MATEDLGFNVFALDKASRTFIRLADRIERVSDKLDELDRKRANPEIDLDVDEQKVRGAVSAIADTADDEGRRRRGGFFRSLFSPNRSIVMALRTGIPAALGSPIGAAAITLGGVFAASFAAAVLSSGVFALIGGGFTALAAVALKNNARLAESFTQLGQVVKSQLSQAAQPLVPVFDEALSTVRGMFGPFIREPLERIFAGLGPTIVPFAESAVRTVGNILDSLSTPQFLVSTRTVLDSITDEMPRLGDAIGGFFTTIASNADDIAEAFEGVVSVMSGLIGFAADLTNAFTDLFNKMREGFGLAGDALSPVVQGLRDVDQLLKDIAGSQQGGIKSPFDFIAPGGGISRDDLGGAPGPFSFLAPFSAGSALIDETGKAAGRASDNMLKLVGATGDAAGATQALADRQDLLEIQLETTSNQLDEGRDALDRLKEGLFGSANLTLNLRDAQRAYEESVDSAMETIAENGATLDINTEKGRENQESIDAITSSTHEQIQAMIESGKSTKEITEFTRQARKDFIKAAEAAGLEAGEARNLADQLGLVPSEVKTKAELIDEATHKIEALEARIAELEREINIRVRITQTRIEAGSAFGGGAFAHSGGLITPNGIRRMHSGGVLRPDERIVIGQTGERILSRSQTRAFDAGVAMGGGGGGVASFTVVNHGVIGSQRETEDWLTRSLDNLKRKGRLPV